MNRRQTADDKEIGARLLAIRHVRTLTQREVAKACGLTPPTLSSIESGRLALDTMRLRALCRVLRVSPCLVLLGTCCPTCDGLGVTLPADGKEPQALA